MMCDNQTEDVREVLESLLAFVNLFRPDQKGYAEQIRVDLEAAIELLKTSDGTGFRRGWDEAMSGDVYPVETLWE